MKIEHVNYTGPAIDDAEILAKLPADLADLLQEINGFIQYHGGFHVRGACTAPAWHSLRAAWLGDNAFHRRYPNVKPSDIPFAEDCMGDQFLLRGREVWRLYGETGEVETLECGFGEFLQNVEDDPGEHLALHPLLKFNRGGRHLEPGQLLSAIPPFCTEESEDGVKLSAVSAEERYKFLASFAATFHDDEEEDD
ncbi:MAG: SMI1/KNR4 family protein [Planctomycetes bacterium]|nr:SMI1/KNR4 family protein [Planctomycetota bacterium]